VKVLVTGYLTLVGGNIDHRKFAANMFVCLSNYFMLI